MIAKCIGASLLWSAAFILLMLPIEALAEGWLATVLIAVLKVGTGALTALTGAWATRRKLARNVGHYPLLRLEPDPLGADDLTRIRDEWERRYAA